VEIRNFGKIPAVLDIPNLTEVQTHSYERFLQMGVRQRKNAGLEAILREMFPIKSYDGKMSLEYVSYDLGKPRYKGEDCRRLKLTYGMPWRVRLRLVKEDRVQEDVYLGDLPIMVGGGEFIVNGAERVIVAQLHRSPGVDFQEDTRTTEKRLHRCRIIPERGSWSEVDVSRKDVLGIRVDQSGRFPVTTFLRAMSPEYSSDEDVIRLFYETDMVPVPKRGGARLRERFAAQDIVDRKTGEILLPAGRQIHDEMLAAILDRGPKKVRLIARMDDAMILNTLAEDPSKSHDEALLAIYTRLRPGTPPNLDRARELFYERFMDADRYRLGRVGRFRLNRKFGQSVPESKMTLDVHDIINSIRYILALRRNEGHVDDIDHLGNRRLRTIDELAGDELRKGFLKLRRIVQERMSTGEPAELTPKILVNSKTISAAIEYFFGRSELSQVVEQTNPLHQLTHERKLSALGPGGLNRKRAGFEVRDVHISHYGRICPIETPEGANIGLITSLGIYASVDKYGFIVAPYQPASKGRPAGRVQRLRADEEIDRWMGGAELNRRIESKGKASTSRKRRDAGAEPAAVIARRNGDFLVTEITNISYIDVSPKQLVGVSASLIPFLEHNDANRALMGSNMQKQAVPLLRCEPPIVTTGMERAVASNSGMTIKAEEPGVVKEVDASHICVGARRYDLRKFYGLNEKTCLNQKPRVQVGQRVKKGEVIADGAATSDGELSLGQNVLVAFMPWHGYNFEDAILISEDLVKKDRYTSVHIQHFEVEVRETKLGREEFTRDIPNVPERALRSLDENGVVRVGTCVRGGDVLVGKVSPKSKSLLIAIFGRASEDVKNDSLEVPAGAEGVVIKTERFTRKSLATPEQREAAAKAKRAQNKFNHQIAHAFREMISAMEKVMGGPLKHAGTGAEIRVKSKATTRDIMQMEDQFDVADLQVKTLRQRRQLEKLAAQHEETIEDLKDQRDQIGQLGLDESQSGVSATLTDELLPSGVLAMVRVYIATKRRLSVGDKMAGRHGNKGVIAKIVPAEDMPFLEDGTPVQIVLNPLGVPSRMNVGQIFETHLGWAASVLGFRAVTPVFDGATEDEIRTTLQEAGLPEDGKAALYDGRTGEPFDQTVTVGYIYMMKLDHLVDDKVHARATGPYSLVTQQPLGGKARSGGQRFGEMEVWAMEAYGAAYALQELLTVKSDDIEGRSRIYESMVKGTNTLEARTPVSFQVLINEIRGLGMKIEPSSK